MLSTLGAGLLTVALILVVPGLSEAQAGDSAETETPEGLFFDVTNINVVNVDVYVTDKKGNRVMDLGPDDFEVYENGQKMEITNFYAVSNGRPLPPPESMASDPRVNRPTRPTLELEEIGRPQTPEDQRLYLIVYVDNFNLHPGTRNRTLNRMHRFISESVGPDDKVMISSYDQSLNVRQTFTSDTQLATSALLDLEELSASAVHRDAERLRVLEDIEDTEESLRAVQAVRSYADVTYNQMTFVLNGLDKQIQALSGLVGRKAIVYVSDGIPMVIGEDLFIAVDEQFERANARLEAAAYDLTSRYRELVAKANASNITFYTLDAGGLRAHDSLSAEYGGSRSGGSLIYIDSIRKANLQEPLHILADDTGGKAITNTNAITAELAKVTQDFKNYYSIGYQPPHHQDGRYYKIEVKTKKRGLKVRHRNGYRDKTAEARLADGSMATLFFGGERNPIEAKISFSSPSGDGRFQTVPMSIHIPLGRVALAPQDGFYIGRVKVSVVVMDEEGGISPVQQQEPVSIKIPAAEIEKARQQNFIYDLGLTLRPGFSRVAIGIRDEIAAETSFLRESINLGSKG